MTRRALGDRPGCRGGRRGERPPRTRIRSDCHGLAARRGGPPLSDGGTVAVDAGWPRAPPRPSLGTRKFGTVEPARVAPGTRGRAQATPRQYSVAAAGSRRLSLGGPGPGSGA
eukprot:539819-Hanusia_phi.AAC.1